MHASFLLRFLEGCQEEARLCQFVKGVRLGNTDHFAVLVNVRPSLSGKIYTAYDDVIEQIYLTTLLSGRQFELGGTKALPVRVYVPKSRPSKDDESVAIENLNLIAFGEVTAGGWSRSQ